MSSHQPAVPLTATLRRVMSLLTPGERRQVYALFVALAFMGLVEAAGIASLGPFLAVMTDPGIVELDGIVGRTYRYFGFDSPNSFVVALGALVLVTVILRNGLSAATTWFALRFAGLRAYSLSARVLHRYLNEPYTFFLHRNAAGLAKNILAESAAFVHGLLLPGIQIVAQGVVVVSVVILLMIVNAALAMFVAVVLGGGFAAVYLVAQRKLRRLGEQQVETNTLRYQATLEALQGIKELKVLGKEQPALERFSVPSESYAKATVMNAAIAQLPRYALETVAIGGMLLVVLYLLAKGSDIRQALPVIGMFAFATYRLMPALQQLFAGITNVRFHSATLDLLVRDLASTEPGLGSDESHAPRDPVAFTTNLALRNVTFRYPGSDTAVMEDLSLDIERGEFIAIVGPTGSGKTTIVDLLVGLLHPDVGRLMVDEQPVTSANVRQWQQFVGYVPQAIFLNDAPLAHNIAFGIADPDMDRVIEASKIAELHDFVTHELPDGYETRVGDRGIRLSGGQRQRIGIARALYRDPALLVLDEATNALDETTQDTVLGNIRESNLHRTVVMVTHRLTTTRFCDRLIDVESGRIVTDRPARPDRSRPRP